SAASPRKATTCSSTTATSTSSIRPTPTSCACASSRASPPRTLIRRPAVVESAVVSESRLAPVEKASVLVEALPYIQKFRGKTIVVKYGGPALGDPRPRGGLWRRARVLPL